MLKRHERLKSNSHDDSVNGQSGLVNELKPIKTEPTPVDTVEKNGDGDVVVR